MRRSHRGQGSWLGFTALATVTSLMLGLCSARSRIDRLALCCSSARLVVRASCPPVRAGAGRRPPLALPRGAHLANVKQLTFGGENAEAYFSFDGKRLSFQSTAGHGCDQIYTMNDRRRRQAARQQRAGPHDVRFYYAGRQVDRLRVDAPGRRRVPAGAEHGAGLRVAHLRQLRHLPRRTSTDRISRG